MTVKSLYGRPLDNARDADFRMLFKDMGYDERGAKKKNKSLTQGHLNVNDTQNEQSKKVAPADVPILDSPRDVIIKQQPQDKLIKEMPKDQPIKESPKDETIKDLPKDEPI